MYRDYAEASKKMLKIWQSGKHIRHIRNHTHIRCACAYCKSQTTSAFKGVGHLTIPDGTTPLNHLLIFFFFNFIGNINKTKVKLTATELKVCILIKLNMNTKDIAQITFNSPRTIEKHRENIRKKLKLTKEDNLYNYLTYL